MAAAAPAPVNLSNLPVHTTEDIQQIMNRLNELYANLARVTKVRYNQTAAHYAFELQTYEGCEFSMIYTKSPGSAVYTLFAGPLFNDWMDPEGGMPVCGWSPVREDEVRDVSTAAVESIPAAAPQSGGHKRKYRKSRRMNLRRRRATRRAITRRR